ncbi:MAG: mandelate racemase/muconate lactonizing enzyme family protein [Bacteroidia bacterium]|nr:mandelate racemase/muconate lactonizing enzyme family protein [Bacteroidia bacterium]
MVSGIKITDLRTYVFKKATYVKLETNEGISGWGEADHSYPKLTDRVIRSLCKPLIIGMNPFNTEQIWNRIYFEGFEAGNTGLMPGALAGVDNALWDLKGRILNMPVYQLLGGNPVEKVRVYGSFGRSKGDGFKTPGEMAKMGADFVEQGYQTLKVRMQIRQMHLNPDPDPTFEVVSAVRKAVGDQIELFVDFNNGYTAAKAITVARKLAEHLNVTVIEEPVSMQDYRGLRQVVEALDIPVQVGEHEYNKWQFRELILLGNPDTLNLDTIKCAGLTECHKIAGMAQAFEKDIMMHNTRPTLATAASLHLISSIGNAARVQEHAGKREELGLGSLFQNEIKYQDGYLFVPQEAGLGLMPDEKMMEKTKLNQ